MNNQKIFMFMGKKRSGKDFIAEQFQQYFKENYNITPPIFRFADKLKEIVAKIFSITLEELEFAKNNPLAITKQKYPNSLVLGVVDFRKILQNTGEVLKEYFGDDIWVIEVTYQINSSDSNVNLISDLRLPLEVEEIKRYYEDVVIIKILGGEEGDPHRTENSFDEIEEDYAIDNSNYINKKELWRIFKDICEIELKGYNAS